MVAMNKKEVETLVPPHNSNREEILSTFTSITLGETEVITSEGFAL